MAAHDTVGRLVPIKAHEVFLAAGAQVLAEVPGALFVIVGEGEREAELKALAAPPPLAGHVHFLGNQPVADMPKVYAGFQSETKDGKVTVTSVTADAPAGKAGLKEGDLITAIDGIEVKTYEAMIDEFRKKSPNEKGPNET